MIQKRRRSAACLLAGSLFLMVSCSLPSRLTSSPEPSTEGTVVPFSYDPVDLPAIVVKVSINGKPPLPFLVDTGLNLPMLIDKNAAHKLDLEPSGETITLSPGSVRMNRASVEAFLVPVGSDPLELGSHKAYVGDLQGVSMGEGKSRVVGIIGAPMLAFGTWQVDFAAQTLTIYPGSHSPSTIRTATSIPMKKRYDLYYVPIEPGEGISSQVLVDTGSTNTSLTPDVLSRLEPLPSLPGVSSSISTLDVTDELLLPSLKLGDLTEANLVVDKTPSSDVPRIGLNLLSRFRVTLDFPRKLLTLERSVDYEKHSRVNGAASIILVKDENRFYVASVEASSAAALSGIHKDDQVLGVDGHPLKPLSLAAAQDLVDGAAGTQARLTVSRPGGQLLHLTFQRGSEFHAAGNPVVGLSMQQEKNGPLLISSVQRESPGERAGLKQGDEITALNGIPTEDLSPLELGFQLRLPEVTLTIRRQDEDEPRRIKLRGSSGSDQ